MKIDRLIGILSILLQKERVTAPELAARFDVSRRTISRDIEDLCKAGIPVCTIQGAGGGICIMDDYRIDRTLLTSKELRMILAGLRSLDSVSSSHYYSQLMEKLQSGSSDLVGGRDSILIDLSSWYKDSLAPRITLIQDAIEEKRLLAFDYYGPGGSSTRLLEPYYLIFKWSSWYVWGWCTTRKDFRMFKLNRMDNLQKGSGFELRRVSAPELSSQTVFPGNIKVKAIFDRECKWRLVEEFGLHCFSQQEDGSLLFTAEYTNKENLIMWLLTFGAQVEVLEPVEIQRELVRIAQVVVDRDRLKS